MYIGIDPGLTGAISLIGNNGEFKELIDMPTMAKNKAGGVVKNCVNARALHTILMQFAGSDDLSIVAFLENVNAMPGQGVSSVFSLGDTFGSIRSVLACCNIETNLIAPQTWKKYFKIGKDKEVVRALAIRLYPEASEYLKRKKDHNRAEALLIARYGYKNK
jgi:crossover junction endodeoxyribonuclease RuvC